MRLSAIVALIGLAAVALPSGAVTHFELSGSPVQDVVPPDCSDWIEISPNFGAVHHQDSYEDDGDGLISVCDHITLNGTRYHIDWVGPTYETYRVYTGQRIWFEPLEVNPSGNPECETWRSVHSWRDERPHWHVREWDDGDGDDVVSVCDVVWFEDDNRGFHIENVGLNIVGTEAPNPVEESTWSRIKEFFRNLLRF
jgi:hypothetical protein